MMALVKALTRQVHAFDPEQVFLASDCTGAYGWNHVPGYAMMADGTYQDSHCDSVGNVYLRPAFCDNHRQNAIASSHETRTAGCSG